MKAAHSKLLSTAGAALCVLLVAGCASTVSTSGYAGPDKEVAQEVATLQSDAQASDQKKICSEVFSSSVVARLGGQQGCEKAVKTQLAEIDNLEATVHSVKLTGTTATATLVTIVEGKKHFSTVTLVKESGGWRVSGVQ
jgi:outer membrane murein-binding lipoprotein Lpp